MTLFEKHSFLIDNEIVTDSELALVVNICGYSDETMESILYARTGYHDFTECESELYD